MEENKGLKQIFFNLDDPEQKKAYDFLNKIIRRQAKFLTALINKYLSDNNVTDVSALTTDEAKELCKYAQFRFLEEPARSSSPTDSLNALTTLINALNQNSQMSLLGQQAQPTSSLIEASPVSSQNNITNSGKPDSLFADARSSDAISVNKPPAYAEPVNLNAMSEDSSFDEENDEEEYDDSYMEDDDSELNEALLGALDGF